MNKQARASKTLRELLQRLLCQLSRPEEAAPALKSCGLPKAPIAKGCKSTGPMLSHTLLTGLRLFLSSIVITPSGTWKCFTGKLHCHRSDVTPEEECSCNNSQTM